MSPLTESVNLVLRNTYVGTDDPDAAVYITAVEAADTAAGQSGGLETATKVAIHSFVKGCKADGIWTAIKASCILAGARTLSGALVPLVGTAPTNVGPFVAGDYNRKTGLVGDAATKYLNSNRAGNADPQNNVHLSAYSTTAHDPVLVPGGNNPGGANIGNGFNATGSTHIGVGGGLIAADYKTFARSRSATANLLIGPTRTSITFQGQSRSSASEYTVRVGGANYTQTVASEAPLSTNYFVFGRTDAGSLNLASNGRLAFYSIGESLDLAKLDTRVTALINAIGAAIP